MKPSLLLLIAIICSCSPKPIPKVEDEEITQYRYILLRPSDVYEKPDFSARHLAPVFKGDTITTYNVPIKVDGWNAIERNGYLVYVVVPSAYAITAKKIRQKKGSSPIYLASELLPTYKGVSVFQSNPLSSTPTTGATIHTGPRGGRYYYNSNGNKTYIKKK